MKCGLFILSFIVMVLAATAQNPANKIVGKKKVALADSLKTAHYPYIFPIWGQRVVNKGFNMPKSAGLSAQYLGQKSDILINNLMVGFNGGPLYKLDDIIRFNSAKSTTNGVNIRPDLWVFPFLNVYGILASSKTSTSIDAGVWLPDDSSWKKVTDLKTKANFNATTFGFGLTPTVGVGGFFMALDVNFTWSDIAELEKPAFAFVFGPRFGKNIAFKNPNRTLALWAGGFRLSLNSGTSGSLNTSDLFPVDQWQANIDTGYMKVAGNQEKVDSWWEGLSPQEQKNPVNIAKHESANSVLARAGALLDAASQVVTNAGNATIQYSLDKKPKDMWNFILGAQFQYNRNWMLRVEYGFLGSRSQVIAGLQYRFDL